ncbi:MAG: HDOD domain-containing protein [Halomonas sp.]|nr:HDOD domain-containing protein [Halomonas sp.]
MMADSHCLPPLKHVLFARQPIYDRHMVMAGCELLFRTCNTINALPGAFDGDEATRQVMLNAFTEDNIHNVCENTPAFINFTANTLKGDLPFSPADLVIEILETVIPNDDIVQAVCRSRKQGYRIALDDYTQSVAQHPLLPYADIVKLDYRAYSRQGFAEIAARLKQAYPDLTLLAEKVEDHHEFEHCLQSGCELFQGYFLAKPAIVEGQRMPQNRLSILQLLAKLNQPNIETHELAELIRQDPFLSLRLLKIANSSLFYRHRHIDSVHAAVSLLGQRRIRSLASLLALSKLDDKPHALQKLVLQRGYLCEALADNMPGGAMSGFTVGLFSILDAFFDQSLARILNELPLHDSLRYAILEQRGPLGKVLETALYLERGEPEHIDWATLAAHGISSDTLNLAQQSAVTQASVLH